MSTPVKPIPDGYHAVTPYLIVGDAARALEFYKTVFGGTEILRMPSPGGKIGHAEMQIGSSKIMLADEHPEMGARGPKAFGGSPISIHLYVEDVDAVYSRAITAGATEKAAVKDQFYGDRSGTVTDPFGHTWHISTHKEDLSPEEIAKRAAALHGQ